MKHKKSALIIMTIAIVIGAVFFIIDSEYSQADEGKVVFSSNDFTCTGCEQKLETALENIIGIEEFTINKEANEVTIYYDETMMKPKWIEKSLEASGFSGIELK